MSKYGLTEGIARANEEEIARQKEEARKEMEDRAQYIEKDRAHVLKAVSKALEIDVQTRDSRVLTHEKWGAGYHVAVDIDGVLICVDACVLGSDYERYYVVEKCERCGSWISSAIHYNPTDKCKEPADFHRQIARALREPRIGRWYVSIGGTNAQYHWCRKKRWVLVHDAVDMVVKHLESSNHDSAVIEALESLGLSLREVDSEEKE